MGLTTWGAQRDALIFPEMTGINCKLLHWELMPVINHLQRKNGEVKELLGSHIKDVGIPKLIYRSEIPMAMNFPQSTSTI